MNMSLTFHDNVVKKHFVGFLKWDESRCESIASELKEMKNLNELTEIDIVRDSKYSNIMVEGYWEPVHEANLMINKIQEIKGVKSVDFRILKPAQ